MIKIITDKENGEMRVSLVFQLAKTREKVSKINSIILGFILEVLFNKKPETVYKEEVPVFNSVSKDNEDLDTEIEPIKFKKKHFIKGIASLSIIGLILQTTMFGSFLGFAPKTAEAQEMCSVDVDVVLIMDVSGSMAHGETPNRCEWSQLDWIGSQQDGSYQWIGHCEDGNTNDNDGCVSREITSGEVTIDWCNSKDSVSQHGVIFTSATNSKIIDAKSAANSFVNNLDYPESNDQSALVSFSSTAKIEKPLDNDHNATKSAVDILTTDGATNIGDAIKEGIKVLEGNNPKANKVMILLTDGQANKPNGNGYDENPADIQYAKDKAAEAANQGYKIFTIGLGDKSGISEDLLIDIADITGATYHHAENGDDLSKIYYNEDPENPGISQEMCQYGSISGCKFNDLNGNGVIDINEPTIPNWQVNLFDGTATTTQTIIDGCYTFAGLDDDNYIITETIPDGWIQTYPEQGFYNVTISNHNDEINKDFANYEPFCGNNILDNGEGCDDGNTDDGDGCSSICQIELPSCDGSITGFKYDSDTQDGLPNWVIQLWDAPESLFATTTTNTNGEYLFTDLCAGTYQVNEQSQCGWTQILPNNPSYYELDLAESEVTTTKDFYNQATTTPSYACSNGIDDDNDGLIDFPDDPGCSSEQDNDETDPQEPVYACSNGVDDDMDGLIDFSGGDPGCNDAQDDDETDELVGIQEGDIVINEIMQNPLAVYDFSGEWFELYNNSNKTLDLQNCVISDNGSDSHTINSSLLVNSGGYLIFGRSYNSSLNGGITPDYKYSGMTLDESDDEVILTCDSVEIDRVEYNNISDWPVPNGASMTLASPSLDNNVGSNWCEASSFYGLGDLGTPGALNDPCAGICELSISGSKFDYDTQLGLKNWEIELRNTSDEVLDTTITNVDGSYSFDDLCQGVNYRVNEVEQSGWTQISPDSYWEFTLDSSTTTIHFINQETPQEPEPEPEPEPTPAGPAGGGGGPTSLIIFNEENGEILSETALVSWFTNILATTRVIYDTVSHPDNQLGTAPNYGYAYSTVENPTKVTFHEIILTGLTPGVQYFWRAVSSASPEVLGDELSFTIEIPAPAPSVPTPSTPTPTPSPSAPTPIPPVSGIEAESTEEIIEPEETAPEEEVAETEETESEEEVAETEDKTNNFLAAISSLFGGENYCWILTLFLTLFLILYLMYKRRKEKRDKNNGIYKEKKYDWDLVGILIIFIVLMFLIECYFLLIPIIVTIAYWLYYYFRKDKEQKI